MKIVQCYLSSKTDKNAKKNQLKLEWFHPCINYTVTTHWILNMQSSNAFVQSSNHSEYLFVKNVYFDISSEQFVSFMIYFCVWIFSKNEKNVKNARNSIPFSLCGQSMHLWLSLFILVNWQKIFLNSKWNWKLYLETVEFSWCWRRTTGETDIYRYLTMWQKLKEHEELKLSISYQTWQLSNYSQSLDWTFRKIWFLKLFEMWNRARTCLVSLPLLFAHFHFHLMFLLLHFLIFLSKEIWSWLYEYERRQFYHTKPFFWRCRYQKKTMNKWQSDKLVQQSNIERRTS